MIGLQILDPGALTTVQDRGRFGFGALGIGTSGALDASSADAANRLVANDPNAAVLEITMGGFEAVACRRLLITLTGAQAPIRVDGTEHPAGALIDVRHGATIRVGIPQAGVRSYLAIRGGIAVPAVLGSRSTDTLGQLGPPQVRAGDELGVGNETSGFPATELLPSLPDYGRGVVLRFVPGPRDDWFTAAAMETLLAGPWRIDPSSNRIGIRLEGPALERRRARELPSEGVVLGSIQVPPSGPIVFHRDHPVTGGYPVIGVLEAEDLDAVAQTRAGDQVRFLRATP